MVPILMLNAKWLTTPNSQGRHEHIQNMLTINVHTIELAIFGC